MKGPFSRTEMAVLAIAPPSAAGLGWAFGWAEWWHGTAPLRTYWQGDAIAVAAFGLVVALLGIALRRWRAVAIRLKERDVVEDALRESEARFRAIYDNAGAGILLSSPEGSILAANAAFQHMVGYAEAELRRIGWQRLIHPDDAAVPPVRPAGLAPGGGDNSVERCLVRKNGDPIWLKLTTSYAFDGRERPFLGIAVVEDVTVRRRAEEALKAANDQLEQRVEQRTRELQQEIAERVKAEATVRESERKFRALIENALDFITVLDRDGVIRFQGPSIKAMLGLDPDAMVGVSGFDFIHPEDRGRAQAIFQDGIRTPGFTASLQFRIRNADGEWRLMEAIAKNLLHDPAVDGVVVNSRDVTARQQAEQNARLLQNELAHVARLSTMGEMAAGFAHELNQPLTAIQNYARGCVRRLRAGSPPTDEICEAMESAARQAHRAGEIIRRIRWFIRRDEPELASIDINAVIREAVDLMESEARQAAVAVNLDLAPSLPWAKGDAIQLQQILINLMRNGIEAMAEDREGPRRLTIRTVQQDDGDIAITVVDTGFGIPDGIRGRLFEPFFTTKPQGLGMGLSICRSIIERHGGTLAIEESEARGTVIRFTLKVADGAIRLPLPAAGLAPSAPRSRPADPLN